MRDEEAPAPAPGSPAIERPRKPATRGKNSGELIDFEAGKRKIISASESNSKPIVATCGRKRKTPEQSLRIEPLKSSKNRWKFRVRWTEEDGSRPHFDISYVSDQVYNFIREDEREYAVFKNQLIEEFRQGAFWTSHQSGTGTRSVL